VTEVAPAPAHPARQYRGHELPEQPSAPQDIDAEQRGHSVRMYRGQRVYA